jgi:flavin-dependent dehydrogenase
VTTATGFPVESEVWDAVVIGAGPAGSLAAHELAVSGSRVLLVERKPFPRDKVCGACLNGQAMAVLQGCGLGKLVAGLGGVELHEFQLKSRGHGARIDLPVGAAISRSRFDKALVDAAVDRGVRFMSHTQATVGRLENGARMVRLADRDHTTQVAARVVLAAAGLGNPCRQNSAEHLSRIDPGSRIGAGCDIAQAPDFYGSGTIYMAVGDDGYVGLVRIEDGSLNVAAAFDSEFVRRRGGLGSAAAEIVRESGFPAIPGLELSHWQGTPRLTRRARVLAEERLFVLGDATGYVEPITGEGMAWALASAQAIAPLAHRAIDRWNGSLIREWSSIHRRLVIERQLVCRLAALTLRKPWLTRIAIELMTRTPRAAGRIVGRLNAPPSLSTKAS